MFSSTKDIFRKHPLYPSLMQLLYWVDLRRSLLVWSIFNIIIYHLTLGGYSILTFFPILFTWLMIFSRAVYYWAVFRNLPDPFESYSVELFIPSPAVVNATLDSIYQLICLPLNAALRSLGSSDHAFSSKICSAALLVGYLVGSISGITLLWIGVNLLFVCPKVYHEKRTVIDETTGRIGDLIRKKSDHFIQNLPDGARSLLKLKNA
eukprot:TRINITY_DN4525_c0_g1_i1.p1 TRINITY_DN4525_c0_g1~~TRINITY_DN4525_c0_g1_i1.p1  ORF type:complete len:207 (-),score=21.47 TRINITY_DN4525_c0_g1_i1:90-710(-)